MVVRRRSLHSIHRSSSVISSPRFSFPKMDIYLFDAFTLRFMLQTAYDVNFSAVTMCDVLIKNFTMTAVFNNVFSWLWKILASSFMRYLRQAVFDTRNVMMNVTKNQKADTNSVIDAADRRNCSAKSPICLLGDIRLGMYRVASST